MGPTHSRRPRCQHHYCCPEHPSLFRCHLKGCPQQQSCKLRHNGLIHWLHPPPLAFLHCSLRLSPPQSWKTSCSAASGKKEDPSACFKDVDSPLLSWSNVDITARTKNTHTLHIIHTHTVLPVHSASWCFCWQSVQQRGPHCEPHGRPVPDCPSPAYQGWMALKSEQPQIKCG